MNNKGKIKENTGITLIGLAITIIILLILSGVSLNLLLGEEGIINRAITSSKNYDLAGAKEQVELLAATYSSNFYQEKYLNSDVDVTNISEYVSKRLKNETRVGDYDLKTTGTTVIVSKGDNKASGAIKEDGSIDWNAWTQDKTIVTKGDVTLEVGTKVNNYTVTGYAYLTWYVLGAKNGKLLLTTNFSSESVTLSGKNDYIEGVEKLNSVAAKYTDEKYADTVRIIDVNDINRVTGYNPDKAKYKEGQIDEYGNEITYYWDGSDKPYYKGKNNTSGKLRKTHNTFFWFDTAENGWISLPKSITAKTDAKEEIIKLTSTYYSYKANSVLDENSEEWKLLFANTSYPKYYWLGSTCILCYDNCVDFGLRYVCDGGVAGHSLANSYGNDDIFRYWIRPVVSLKSDAKIINENGEWKIE